VLFKEGNITVPILQMENMKHGIVKCLILCLPNGFLNPGPVS